jgi:hypothetical protein
MPGVDLRSQVQALLARELKQDAASVSVGIGPQRGPYDELRFSVDDVDVVLLCSQWETVVFVDEAIRWEITAVTDDEGSRNLAMLVRSLRQGGLVRSGEKSSLALEDGERLSGRRL